MVRYDPHIEVIYPTISRILWMHPPPSIFFIHSSNFMNWIIYLLVNNNVTSRLHLCRRQNVYDV